MSEKKIQELKNKMRASGLRMESPFSKATGFLICWVDEHTDERRTVLSPKWSDAYALFHKLAKSTPSEVWKLVEGRLVGLPLSNDKALA